LAYRVMSGWRTSDDIIGILGQNVMLFSFFFVEKMMANSLFPLKKLALNWIINSSTLINYAFIWIFVDISRSFGEPEEPLPEWQPKFAQVKMNEFYLYAGFGVRGSGFGVAIAKCHFLFICFFKLSLPI
jgi:hypothetical protein